MVHLKKRRNKKGNRHTRHRNRHLKLLQTISDSSGLRSLVCLAHNPQARDEGIGHDHAVQQNAGQSLRSDNLSCGSERHLAASGLGIPAVKRIKVNRKQNAHICIEEHQGLNNLPVAILAGLHQSSLRAIRKRYILDTALQL
jgi:hypothetical protein